MTKFQLGDEIRVIAPSCSWQERKAAVYKRAERRAAASRLNVTFGEHIKQSGRFGTASVSQRLADLHSAYRDPNVKAVWCLAGGWSANQLLPGLDWELIGANPKPLIGFSDITVLLNALYAKTGQAGLLASNFATIGGRLYEYSLDSLIAALTGTLRQLRPSRQWADRKLEPRRTPPWQILSPGQAQGVLLGGNLGSFYLLQGTPYQPRFDRSIILALEDDDEAGAQSAREFDRRLESILQLPGARQYIRGVLVGRFQPGSKVTRPDVRAVIQRTLGTTIPVIAGLDFGHTRPQLALPIGGIIKISAGSNQAQIELVEY